MFKVYWVASKADQALAMDLGYEGEPATFEHEGEWIELGDHSSIDLFVEGVWPGTYVFVDRDGLVDKLTVHHVTREEQLVAEHRA